MTALRTWYAPSSRITATRLASGGITLTRPPDQNGEGAFAVLIPTGEWLRVFAHLSTATPDEAFDEACRLYGGSSMEAA